MPFDVAAGTVPVDPAAFLVARAEGRDQPASRPFAVAAGRYPAVASDRGGRRHGHLWQTLDGTGLHAPPGSLIRDDTGAACCHYCGCWFAALGSHVRVHGLSAAAYREATGLSKTLPLAAPTVSARISKRQSALWRTSPQLRAAFATGQRLAKSGALTAQSVAANKELRPQTAAIRQASLRTGREKRAGRRLDAQAMKLAEMGASSLDGYLREQYAAGVSLEDLARATGLGRDALRRAMTSAGIAIRPTGINSSKGKVSRARTADQVAAKLVGTDDLPRWLAQRRDEGQTLGEFADAVGHSYHWVQWRLDRLTGTHT
jgi:hypothetical protein